MLLLALVALMATRRTSSALEKSVLVLTSAICALFIASVGKSHGYNLPSLFYSHSLLVGVSCAAALLAGWRLFEVAVVESAEKQ